jgi:hypothetical protein
MSYTKITYKGITETISSNLFDNIDIKINKPKKSNRFAKQSLYYNGIYYFFNDIEKTINDLCKNNLERSIFINTSVWDKLHKGLVFKITIGYFDKKWIQDKEYISSDFKDFLLSYIKS